MTLHFPRILRTLGLAFGCALLFADMHSAQAAVNLGVEVVVIYNSQLPDSKKVAEHYADRRQVPRSQVFGFDLPTSEAISRKDYLEKLEQPLVKKLEQEKLFVFGPATNRYPDFKPTDPPVRRVVEASVRYAVLCYGVPTKIQSDPNLKESGQDQLPVEIRRTEAAVDTQLALCPNIERKLNWTGPMPSPFYGFTNATMMHPTNSLLMVTRIDGPSAAIAQGLVDKAMDAETNGLWGRAYFDARGLGTNDPYFLGDTFMRGAAMAAEKFGFETELDNKPETFSPGYPMSQIALYAGWYDQAVKGPFLQPTIEFMPGAFAYHLYSFSAQTIRSANNSWVGTLLEKGATCTMGAVDEPYLSGTPDIAMFVGRLTFGGFTFGEAAYTAQGALSWQTTIIGDPLYRPFGKSFEALHKDLEKRGSKLLEWSHLLVVDRNITIGSKPAELIAYLEPIPTTRQSAVLTEKLGDLYSAKGNLGDSVDTYETALKRGPSPQQKIRLLLKCGEKRALYGPDAKAYAHYDTLLKEFPDYAEALSVYQRMLPIAKRLNKPDEIDRCEKETKRLSPPPPPKP